MEGVSFRGGGEVQDGRSAKELKGQTVARINLPSKEDVGLQQPLQLDTQEIEQLGFLAL